MVALCTVRLLGAKFVTFRFVKVAFVPVTSARTSPLPEAFEKLSVLALKVVAEAFEANS